jgi:hypothetical protein
MKISRDCDLKEYASWHISSDVNLLKSTLALGRKALANVEFSGMFIVSNKKAKNVKTQRKQEKGSAGEKQLFL